VGVPVNEQYFVHVTPEDGLIRAMTPGQYVVTCWADGDVQLSFRPHGTRSWGPPIDAERVERPT
jgi:hypothetical protein